MQVFRHLEEVPSDFRPTTVSVGNFDGVHRAHHEVVNHMVANARTFGGKAVVVTFDPHPYRILRPDVAPKLLTPLAVKLKLLEQTGVDAVLLLPFTRDLSLTSAEDFARQVLVNSLHAREVHEGYNFHFGHKAQGNVNTLAELGRQCGFEAKVYSEMILRGYHVSSSEIRKLLAEGEVDRARALLGRPFSIVSNPGRGRGYGHKYTVPTVNLARYDELVPADGVYITWLRVGRECFEAVTNVGNRPTFGEESFAIESHLLNFHPIELLPDTELELFFLKRLRGEIKFPSIDALREQIAKDVHKARRYFRLKKAEP
ncbi:MAG TPA: bifunctional riboflavin kinase/FAD synthetase [Terriglobales bacterium]|jgi:riboflavin kinase/FMN adenylyltransferase|nr:bifunctional riboflavin kinase/FAD synthetase [Terriglobales bacterium]